MSVKSERKRTKKAQKQAAATKKRTSKRAENAETENFVVYFVARLDDVDHIVQMYNLADGEVSQESNALEALVHEGIKKSPETTYVNFFRLYENGRAVQRYGTNEKTDPTIAKWFNEITADFQERLESQYYAQAFPENAAKAKEFVQRLVQTISSETNVPVQWPEDSQIDLEKLKDVVRTYLEDGKQQITETGSAKGMVGFGIETGIFVIPQGLSDLKYLEGRAISEVAAIINAPFIVCGGEGWFTDVKTERREEVLWMDVIFPDGSVATQGLMTIQRKPLKFGEIQTPTEELRVVQNVFPKWAYFQASTERAVA